MQQFSGRKLFTLIEMLVVISIISILAALLSPALHKSMNTARAVNCSNNLKALALCANQYGADFRGYVAPPLSYPGKTSADNDEPHIPNCWYIYYGEMYLSQGKKIKDASSSNPHVGGAWDTFRCPGDPKERSQNSYAGSRSYVMAGTWLMYCPGDFRNGRLVTLPRCRPAQKTYLILESNPEDGGTSEADTGIPAASKKASKLNKHANSAADCKIGTYHSGATNMAYADGSVRLRFTWKHRYNYTSRMCSEYFWRDSVYGTDKKDKSGAIDD